MTIRRILILLGIFGVCVLIISTFGHPGKIVEVFAGLQWYTVPLFVSVQFFSYFSNSKYYQNFFHIFGHEVPLRRMYQIALGINFANQTIPSGGVSGAAYLGEALKGYGVPFGRAAVAQLGRFSFTIWSFFITLGLGFLLLFLTGDFDRVSLRFVMLFTAAILAFGLALFLIFSDRRRLEKTITPMLTAINFIGRKIFRRHKKVFETHQVKEVLDDFYHAYQEIMARKGTWPRLLWWTIGSILAEALTVYVVFIGFGHVLNPGIVLTGYALAIIASVIGFFMGGIGIYEAGMIATFTALGVEFPLAFAVVLVYRALNLAIFVPVGLHFYRRDLQEGEG